MSRRYALFSFVLLVLACLSVPLPAQVRAMQFSADMKFSGKGASGTGKLYFGGTKVRMEMTTMGHTSIMLMDTQRKISDMLMPDQKMYMEMSTEGMGAKKSPDWRTYDPANPCANVPDATCQKIGPGTADGHLCTKWLFTRKKPAGTETVWVDMKSGIPLRTETSEGLVFELSNVREGAPDASLFQIPAGYQKFSMGGMMKNARQD